MDISMMIGNIKYNFRVGAILKYDNKILIEKGKKVPFYVIPGGRVKLSEDTKSALEREINEELEIDISNLSGKLISIIENFFIMDNIEYHELYFIYKYNLKNNFNIKDGMENVDSHNSNYYWKNIDDISDVEILPITLKEIVKIDEFKNFVVRN